MPFNFFGIPLTVVGESRGLRVSLPCCNPSQRWVCESWSDRLSNKLCDLLVKEDANQQSALKDPYTSCWQFACEISLSVPVPGSTSQPFTSFTNSLMFLGQETSETPRLTTRYGSEEWVKSLSHFKSPWYSSLYPTHGPMPRLDSYLDGFTLW